MIKIIFFMGILFLCSIKSQANTFLSLGFEARLIKDVENNHQLEYPRLFFGGYKNLPWFYAFEALYYSNTEASSGSYTAKYSHFELVPSVGYFLMQDESRLINPYIIGGIGLLRGKVKTEVAGLTTYDQSRLYATGKIGAGLWISITEKFFSNFEIKGMLSDAYSPKLIFGLAFRFGLEF